MYILNSVSSKKELQSLFLDDVLFKIYSYQIFFKDKKNSDLLFEFHVIL